MDESEKEILSEMTHIHLVDKLKIGASLFLVVIIFIKLK